MEGEVFGHFSGGGALAVTDEKVDLPARRVPEGRGDGYDRGPKIGVAEVAPGVRYRSHIGILPTAIVQIPRRTPWR
jgi:hypothetical protein